MNNCLENFHYKVYVNISLDDVQHENKIKKQKKTDALSSINPYKRICSKRRTPFVLTDTPNIRRIEVAVFWRGSPCPEFPSSRPFQGDEFLS